MGLYRKMRSLGAPDRRNKIDFWLIVSKYTKKTKHTTSRVHNFQIMGVGEGGEWGEGSLSIMEKVHGHKAKPKMFAVSLKKWPANFQKSYLERSVTVSVLKDSGFLGSNPKKKHLRNELQNHNSLQ